MLPGQTYTPDDIARIAWRGKWVILAALAVAGPVTAAYQRLLPDIYRSDTTILVVPQRVPDSYVQSTVTGRIEDRLQSISQQLLSRSRLEPIILEFDLYREARAEQPMEDVVVGMRRQIDVRTLRGDAFVLGFTSQDPEIARRVTERLASLFIDENLRDREVLADATNQFLESQLEDARRRLIENEKRLEEFRLNHSGELPTQVQNNLQAMQNLQMRAQGLNESLARDRERRLMMERQLEELETVLASTTSSDDAARKLAPVDDPAPGSAARQLAQAQAALAQLLMRLTAEHPDVARAERQIKELEEKAAAERAGAVTTDSAGVVVSPAERRATALRAERAQVERDIAGKERQVGAIETEIAKYRGRLEAVPVRESEMTELMRDYDTIRSVYTSLLAKREASQVAVNLERRQIGEQFRVLDPPRRPERPIRPNRPMITLTGLAIGLGLGLALVALRELRDTTMHNEGQAAFALGLPILATVPRVRNAAERRRRTRLAVSAVAGVVAVVAVAAMAAFRLLR